MRIAPIALIIAALSATSACSTDDTDDGSGTPVDDAAVNTDAGDLTLEVNCTAMPVCDPGHDEVDGSTGCLQDDAVCYERSECGVTIWCTGPDAPQTRLLSGGYQFGECLGACKSEVTFAANVVTLTISDWGDEAPLHIGSATLTQTGQADLDRIMTGLTDQELEQTYGCPDCDDGGETHATILRGAEESIHRWETGEPPVVLEDLDDFIMDTIDDISDCKSTEELEPAAGCIPFDE